MPYIVDIFEPDFSNYNKLLFVDGCPINDINYVNNVTKEKGKLFFEQMQIDSKRDFDIPSDQSYNDDVVFDSFIPQHLDTSGEISDYYDYINNKSD